MLTTALIICGTIFMIALIIAPLPLIDREDWDTLSTLEKTWSIVGNCAGFAVVMFACVSLANAAFLALTP